MVIFSIRHHQFPVWRLGYRLHDRGIGAQYPVEARNALHIYSIEIGFGKHSASWPISVICFFTGVMRPGRKADHSPPSTAVKYAWSYTSSPPNAIKVWLSNNHMDNFTPYVEVRRDVSSSHKTNKTVSLRVFIFNSIWTADRK